MGPLHQVGDRAADQQLEGNAVQRRPNRTADVAPMGAHAAYLFQIAAAAVVKSAFGQGQWSVDGLHDLCKEIGLNGLNENIDLILKGLQKGRVVVNLGE